MLIHNDSWHHGYNLIAQMEHPGKHFFDLAQAIRRPYPEGSEKGLTDFVHTSSARPEHG